MNKLLRLSFVDVNSIKSSLVVTWYRKMVWMVDGRWYMSTGSINVVMMFLFGVGVWYDVTSKLPTARPTVPCIDHFYALLVLLQWKN